MLRNSDHEALMKLPIANQRQTLECDLRHSVVCVLKVLRWGMGIFSSISQSQQVTLYKV
jgi:hypothetical protein